MVKQHLQVFARIKPLEPNSDPLPSLEISDNSIELLASRTKLSNAKDSHLFSFHGVFDQQASQDEVFQRVAKPVIDNCLEGYNGTVFAYGQTGSGKTYTMSGGDLWPDRGIIPRVLSYIFDECGRRGSKFSYDLSVSFIEIYNQNAYDLLEPRHSEAALDAWTKIVFMEDEEASLQMKNLSLHPTTSQQEALNLLLTGSYVRRTACTQLNQVSSRSHCIFTINVRGRDLATGSELFSKIHLVDLAGSERVSKSMAEGIVLTQAKSINLSLTYLEQVIVSLNQKVKNKAKAAHVPYRNSLLTTLLRDSLGGNCKTVMVATISAERSNLDETISTLRFAQRVKLVENQINKNQKNPLHSRIELLQRENAMLKRKVARYEEGASLDSQEVSLRVEKFMNSQDGHLQVDNIAQAQVYLAQVKRLYHSKLGEYVRQLTFISQKLSRYDQIVLERRRKN